MPAPMRTKQPHPIPPRDLALKQLAAESRSFAEQNAEAAPAVRKLLEQYERKISSLPEVKTHLDKLKARGVNLERVLKCLAAFVVLERDATWHLKVDANKVSLRRVFLFFLQTFCIPEPKLPISELRTGRLTASRITEHFPRTRECSNLILLFHTHTKWTNSATGRAV
jgi:hypothetical protein